MAMRKLHLGGAWWAQRRDGSWLRWSGGRGDWEAAPPPPGETHEPPEAEAPPFAFPVDPDAENWSLPSPLGLLKDYVLTFLWLAVPTAAVGLLLLPLAIVAQALFSFLLADIITRDSVESVASFTAVYLAFLAAAMVITRRSPVTRWWGLLGWAAAFGVLLVGSMLAVRAAGWRPPDGVLAELNVGAWLGLLVMAAFAALDKLVSRRTRRLPWWTGLLRD